jgi:RNA binding exosome subunit
VALLDLEKASREWLQSMTEEEAAQYYVTLDKKALAEGEYQLNEAGAKVVAEMAREAIMNTSSKKLQKILKK